MGSQNGFHSFDCMKNTPKTRLSRMCGGDSNAQTRRVLSANRPARLTNVHQRVTARHRKRKAITKTNFRKEETEC